MSKIQSALNNLNVKIQKFGEEKKLVEDEVLRKVTQSRCSPVTEQALEEISEMVSISDYQSALESMVETLSLPTFREQQDKKQNK